MRKRLSSVARQARYVFAGCGLLGSSPALAADPTKDLAGAFIATYQQAPPLVSTIKQPVSEYEHPEGIVEVLTQTAILAPVRIVKLGDAHYALLVSETVQNVGHAWPGAFSISYLHYHGRWVLERNWSELTFMGQTGIPADVTWAARFWSEPLILASSTYCGMGGCETSVAAFSLGQKAPRFLGRVPGSAEYRGIDPVLSTCESYHYIAQIGAPASRKNVLSVSYGGWTAPPGRIAPKHWFRRRTDYSFSEGKLMASPNLKIPDCGK